jgi:release factor glutamine methyltransferase
MHYVCSKFLGYTRAQLISNNQSELPNDLIQYWYDLELQRIQGHPVAYLVQKKAFFDIELFVNQNVLIPRPETELLVEIAIDEIDRLLYRSNHILSILDIGTGSGAIILAIAHHYHTKDLLHRFDFVATDISIASLQVAQQNAINLSFDCITWIQSEWFLNIAKHPFDLIISNPPYIAKDDEHLDQGDLRFEPRGALTDSSDGLEAYRVFSLSYRQFLKPNSYLMVEHGYDQRQSIEKLFLESGLIDINCFQDLSGLDRVTIARNPQ